MEPERLRERPLGACQGQEWDRSVHPAKVLARPPLPTMGRSLDHGMEQGIDLGW